MKATDVNDFFTVDDIYSLGRGFYQICIWNNPTNENKNEYISNIKLINPNCQNPEYIDIPIVAYRDGIGRYAPFREILTGLYVDSSIDGVAYINDEYNKIIFSCCKKLNIDESLDYLNLLNTLTIEEKEKYREKIEESIKITIENNTKLNKMILKESKNWRQTW